MLTRCIVYSGDFFTYTDRENQYWSGYFTTRPYSKQLSRDASSALRTAEILYSFAHSNADMLVWLDIYMSVCLRAFVCLCVCAPICLSLSTVLCVCVFRSSVYL